VGAIRASGGGRHGSFVSSIISKHHARLIAFRVGFEDVFEDPHGGALAAGVCQHAREVETRLDARIGKRPALRGFDGFGPIASQGSTLGPGSERPPVLGVFSCLLAVDDESFGG